MYEGSRLLLDIFSSAKIEESRIRNQSFLDEMELLLRTVPAEERSRFARTRLSAQEAIGLEGLALGGNSLS
jgi:hypothetical protein